MNIYKNKDYQENRVNLELRVKRVIYQRMIWNL